MATACSVDISVEDTTEDFEQNEMRRISQLIESPLQTYARYLARLDMTNPRQADQMRMNYPVTRLVMADIIYARRTKKNRIWVINGPTGTLKSFSAMRMASWLDQNGFWTHNKGKYEVPKVFLDVSAMIKYAQTDFESGSTLVLDEEADTQGCLTGDMAIKTSVGDMEIETLFKLQEIKKKLPLVSCFDMKNSLTMNKNAEIVFSGVKEIYRVTLEDGEVVDCSSEQRFLTREGFNHITELMEGEQIAAL